MKNKKKIKIKTTNPIFMVTFLEERICASEDPRLWIDFQILTAFS